MRLKSLSASSAQVYEECPSRWAVEIRDRIPQPPNSAADLGTACHEAFDRLVKNGQHLLTQAEQLQWVVQHYDDAYHELFADTSRYDEGKDMCTDWVKRMYPLWGERTVLSAEEKKHFMLKTSAGEVPFNYIMDRKDQLNNGDIEVVDYKSIIKPLTPEQMRSRIQVRAYALAAQKEHPEAERIWVTYDLLRYDPVSVVFTKAENRATWVYLHNLANRIIADQDAEERLGPGCKWCVRAHVCKSLRKHIDLDGIMSIDTLEAAAQLLIEVQGMKEGIAQLERKATDRVDQLMEGEQLTEWAGDAVEIKYRIQGRRHVDSERLRKVVGDELFLRYEAHRMSGFDRLMASDELDPTTKSLARQLVQKNYSEPVPVASKRDPF